MKTTKITSVKDALYSARVDVQIKKMLNFNLKDAGVLGGEMLVTDPRKWSQLESEHLAAGLNLSSNGHSCESGNP